MDYPVKKDASTLQTQGTKTMEGNSQSGIVEEVVVPVVREELEVHKELRRTGTVRIHKTVRELEEVINEDLVSETVDIQRTPVNLVVDTLPDIRTEGDVTIIPVVKEEVVVTKQLRIVEELRITKRRAVSDYHENITLRAEEVAVERVGPESLKVEAGKA